MVPATKMPERDFSPTCFFSLKNENKPTRSQKPPQLPSPATTWPDHMLFMKPNQLTIGFPLNNNNKNVK